MTMIFRNLDPRSTSEIRQSNNDVKFSNPSRISKEYVEALWGGLWNTPALHLGSFLAPNLGIKGFLTTWMLLESGVRDMKTLWDGVEGERER
jgi:hypothetical protein